MALSPVQRRSVPDDVFDQLVAEVTGGDLAPGEPLPSERRLAEVLGVSRPAVREALQRLATAGLVDVRQGGSTTVRDFRRLGGLDLLPRLLVTGGELDLAVARSILEARLHVGPKIAELAATRSGAADRRRPARDDRHPGRRDRRRTPPAARAGVLGPVVDGADSITFRLMFNSLRAAYEPVLEALAVGDGRRGGPGRGVRRPHRRGRGRRADRRPRARRTTCSRSPTTEPDRRHRRPGDVMTDSSAPRSSDWPPTRPTLRRTRTQVGLGRDVRGRSGATRRRG